MRFTDYDRLRQWALKLEAASTAIKAIQKRHPEQGEGSYEEAAQQAADSASILRTLAAELKPQRPRRRR